MTNEKNTNHVSDSGKKVSSIDWIVDQVEDFFCLLPVDIIEQAREMHRQEIIDAYHINPLETKWQNKGIEYYTETYKQ